jgi:predicted phage terminase large subunit-like protein
LQHAALVELANRELARRHLLEFTTYTWPGTFRVGRHYIYLCGRFDRIRQRVEAGEIVRVMLSMPPRYLKSELTKRFCAQMLGLHPDWPIIYTSYAASLAQEQSRHVRDIVQSDAFSALFGRLSCTDPEDIVELSKDTSAAQRWKIAGHRGGMLAAGAGGGITGFGFKIGVLDDLFKDRKEANSEGIRNDRWDWLRSTFLTRLEEWNSEALAEQGHDAGAAIIFPMTRWHEDDTAGRLIELMKGNPEAERWEVIRLPAIAETQAERDQAAAMFGLPLGEPDPLGREPGEALWPEKHSAKRLRQIAVNSGEFEFGALYQQNPQPGDGGTFKSAYFDRRWTTLPALQAIIQIWDTAYKEAAENDESVGVLVGLGVDWQFYVIDARHGRWAFPALITSIEDFYREYGPAVMEVGIEDKGSGTSAIQTLSTSGLIPVVPIKAVVNKLLRASPTTPFYQAGRVWFPANAPWMDTLIRQHLQFPGGKHDDWVDAVSAAIVRLIEVFGLTASGEQEADGQTSQN